MIAGNVDFDVSVNEDQWLLSSGANVGPDHHSGRKKTAAHGFCYCGLLLTIHEELMPILATVEWFVLDTRFWRDYRGKVCEHRKLSQQLRKCMKWPSEALLTNEEKCVITLSQIFGWRKAIRVVRNNPRVRVVNRLVDFALVEPDEADDDKPGEDILNYAELVDLLKAAKVN
ncbi:hypothetical protein KIN20_023579 [Parelaphostrongylus tenuis]|uniref:Uncharacterized protein n=1 Tax=Parelaphostrongylus tenuis TaxID=148309 RepID=A0AAD5MS32_PARTN|nr:hypothetical protein KIN20_023579 [Parelaphostrongylus tenuis]